MTDDIKKDDVQLDGALGSLDDFLNEENDDGADAFPLDDDDDFAFYNQPKKKSNTVKLLGYTALIALLGGGAYFGYKAMPQFGGSSSLSEFEQNMVARSNNFSDSFGQVALDDDLDDENLTLDESEQLEIDNNNANMADVDVTIVRDDVKAFSDVDNIAMPSIDDDTIMVNETAPIATTISEALDLANNAKDINNGVDDAMNEMETEIAESFDQEFPTEDMPVESVEVVIEEAAPDGFNRIRATPFNKQTVSEQQEPTQPENDIVLMVEDITLNETNESVSDDIQDELTASVENAMENIIDPTEIILEPTSVDVVIKTDASIEDPEVADVEPTVTEKIVKDIPATPTATMPTPAPKVQKPVVIEQYSINNADQLNTAADPRVIEGQRALAAGDFDAANRVFVSILASNPSNIHALTGKQMAVSKIRVPMPAVQGSVVNTVPNNVEMHEQTLPVSVPQTTSVPVEQPIPVTAVIADSEVSSVMNALLSKMKANPRDANVAVQLAQAYAETGQPTQAIELYRKALQLDALYKSGINRMAVYDALSGLQ